MMLIQQAFPESQTCYGGMTLRDYFAAHALPSVINKCVPHECQLGESMEQMFSRKAYLVADAMLAARNPQESASE